MLGTVLVIRKKNYSLFFIKVLTKYRILFVETKFSTSDNRRNTSNAFNLDKYTIKTLTFSNSSFQTDPQRSFDHRSGVNLTNVQCTANFSHLMAQCHSWRWLPPFCFTNKYKPNFTSKHGQKIRSTVILYAPRCVPVGLA